MASAPRSTRSGSELLVPSTAAAAALVLYLRAVGLMEGQVGVLLTLILLGDTAVSLCST